MSDFIRPALYNGYHRILPEFEPPVYPEKSSPEKVILEPSTAPPTPEKPLKTSESFRLAENSRPMPSPRLSRRVDSMPPDLRGSKESFEDLLNELQGNRLFKRINAPVPSPRAVRRSSPEGAVTYDIVGPVCECADFLGVSRAMPRLRMADLLVVTDVGAYGYSMASNYNSRNKPAQVTASQNFRNLEGQRNGRSIQSRNLRFLPWMKPDKSLDCFSGDDPLQRESKAHQSTADA